MVVYVCLTARLRIDDLHSAQEKHSLCKTRYRNHDCIVYESSFLRVFLWENDMVVSA